MKTKLLTLIMLIVASVFYSCTKESDNNPSGNTQNNSTISDAERRFIISNCSGHSGCHGGNKLFATGTMEQVTVALGNTIDARHNLSICERSKLQVWMQGEVNQ